MCKILMHYFFFFCLPRLMEDNYDAFKVDTNNKINSTNGRKMGDAEHIEIVYKKKVIHLFIHFSGELMKQR